MDGIANALFQYDKKDIPVFYDESTEKLTVYFNDEGVALPDHMDKIIVKRLGLLTDGLILYKLSVPLFNTCAIMDGDTFITGEVFSHAEIHYQRDPGSRRGDRRHRDPSGQGDRP